MHGCTEVTDIQRFYKNSTVFVTGATGFIGKLVLEKILRSLPVKKVIILMRKKNDETLAQRLEKTFDSPAFSLIKNTTPEVLEKVVIMEGDCSLPLLGMSEDDQKTFIEEVDAVFHVAATTKFNEHIKKATMINVRATVDVVNLAKQIKRLKTFIYVGTAFSNCYLREVKEEVYPAKISAENLITACESLSYECLESMTKTLIGEWPNTYTFTKQVTEDYISREAKGLPICIVRPAIVISTMAEPIVAFTDNLFGLAGMSVVSSLGLNRIYMAKNIDSDIVPADIVVNQCIAAGWQTAMTFKPYKTATPVYNISSALDNPITMDELVDYCYHYGILVPSNKLISYPFTFRTSSRYNYLFFRFLFHTLVAYVGDLGLKFKGKNPYMVKGVERFHKFQESYEYFFTNSLYPQMENTHKLLKKMSFQDRQMFNCDITTLDWKTYFGPYVKGIRIYCMKDPMDTLPEGRKRYDYLKKVFILFLVVAAIVLYALGKFILFRVIPVVFGIVIPLFRSIVC